MRPGIPGAGRGPEQPEGRQTRPPRGPAGGSGVSSGPDRMQIQIEHDLAMNDCRNRRAALQAALQTIQPSEDGEYLDPAWPQAYDPGVPPDTVNYETALRGASERWLSWLRGEG